MSKHNLTSDGKHAIEVSGLSVYYGDSPAFGKSEVNLRKSGLKEVGDELGFFLADFDSGKQVSHKEALLIKKFVIANGVLDNDGLVSLPRLKRLHSNWRQN